MHYMGWRASYDRDFSFSTKDVVFYDKPARPLKKPRYELEAEVIAVYRKGVLPVLYPRVVNHPTSPFEGILSEPPHLEKKTRWLETP